MTRSKVPADAAAAHADLRRTLTRQFVTATDTVTVRDWSVELLRPRNSDDLISEADFVRDDRLPYWATCGRRRVSSPRISWRRDAPRITRAALQRCSS